MLPQARPRPGGAAGVVPRSDAPRAAVRPGTDAARPGPA